MNVMKLCFGLQLILKMKWKILLQKLLKLMVLLLFLFLIIKIIWLNKMEEIYCEKNKDYGYTKENAEKVIKGING